MALESFRPVLWWLFIDVIQALLSGQGGRKQDQIGVSDAVLYHHVRTPCVDVLGDFQTHDEIILPVQVELLAEVSSQKQVWIDHQISGIGGLVVDAENLSATAIPQDTKPYAGTASEVQHSPYIKPALENIRHHDGPTPGLGRETLMFFGRILMVSVIHGRAFPKSPSPACWGHPSIAFPMRPERGRYVRMWPAANSVS